MPVVNRPLRVFLCHATQDRQAVLELYERLAAQNWIEPWLDVNELLPGQDWRRAIEEAVETADNIIVCLSKNSVTKEGYIQKEMRYAQEISLEKPEGTIFLIPLKLEECEVPRGLRFFQWTDYFGEQKEKNFANLLQSLRIRFEDKIRMEGEEKERLETKKHEQKQVAPQVRKDQQESLARKVPTPNAITLAVIGFLSGVLGNLLAAWIQQDVMQDSFTPLSVSIIILLTVAGIVFGAYLDRNNAKTTGRSIGNTSSRTYWIITIAIIGIIVVNGLAVIFSGGFRTKPETVYLVVDATEKMQPIFDKVREQVQIAASAVREDSRIGLRIFGGDNRDATICQDSQQILVPSEYPKAQALLDRVLAGVSPFGHSSMTGAMLEALFTDIKTEDRPVKLILVTSGIDPVCDPPAADFLKDRAKDIEQNVELLIVSIGDQDENSYRIFDSYAKAFSGHYIPIPNAESLPPLIMSISFYGYGYGYPFYGENTTPNQ